MICISESELYKDEKLIVDPERRWTVYYHQNKVNGKIYVGITSRNLKTRWGKDGKGYEGQAFYNAILKYGWDSGFHHEIFASNLTKDEANKIERSLILGLQTYKKEYGYNVEIGGDSHERYPIPIYQYDVYGNFIRYWDDHHKASKQLNIEPQLILDVCRGKRKYTKSYTFRFEPDNNIQPCGQMNIEYKVLQFDRLGNFIKRWDNTTQVAEHYDCMPALIGKSCKGEKNTLYDSIWLYEHEYLSNNTLLFDRVAKYKNFFKYKHDNYMIEKCDLDGNTIEIYQNIDDMQQKMKLTDQQTQYCWRTALGNSVHKTAYGYKWKIYDNPKNNIQRFYVPE